MGVHAELEVQSNKDRKDILGCVLRSNRCLGKRKENHSAERSSKRILRGGREGLACTLLNNLRPSTCEGPKFSEPTF
jgi:hypothetical protein